MKCTIEDIQEKLRKKLKKAAISIRWEWNIHRFVWR